MGEEIDQRKLRVKTVKFFSFLYQRTEEGFVELRPFSLDWELSGKGRSWVPVDRPDRLVDRAWEYRDKDHLFYGVATRTERSKREGVATQDYLLELPALFADLDFEHYDGGEAEAREIVDDFPFPPSALVYSGHGLHPYYFLEEPFDLQEGNLARVKRLLKTLQDKLLQADSTSDVTRILRVPGSINIKDPAHPKLVESEKLKDLRYPLEDFVDQLARWLVRTGKEEGTGKRSEPGVGSKAKREEGKIVVEKLAVSERIKQLIEGGWTPSDPYQSRSESDQAVITALLGSGYSPEVIFQVFEEHPEGIGEKYYEKKSRGAGEKYLDHSIESARDYLQGKNRG